MCECPNECALPFEAGDRVVGIVSSSHQGSQGRATSAMSTYRKRWWILLIPRVFTSTYNVCVSQVSSQQSVCCVYRATSAAAAVLAKKNDAKLSRRTEPKRLLVLYCSNKWRPMRRTNVNHHKDENTWVSNPHQVGGKNSSTVFSSL